MVKVLTYDIPDYKIELKIRQLQVMGKKIHGKLITQATNGTSVANRCKSPGAPDRVSVIFLMHDTRHLN